MNFQAVWLSIAKCSELMQLISANALESSKPIKMRLSINFFIFLRTFKVQLCFWCVPISDLFKVSIRFLYSKFLIEVSILRLDREFAENLFKRHYNQMSQPDNLDGHFCGPFESIPFESLVWSQLLPLLGDQSMIEWIICSRAGLTPIKEVALDSEKSSFQLL